MYKLFVYVVVLLAVGGTLRWSKYKWGYIVLLWHFYKLALQKVDQLIYLKMIRAPFCFDVEYFSIVVLYAFSPSPAHYYFRDHRQKDAYLSSLAKNTTLSPKEIKEIDRQNFYYDTTQSTPILYIIVQNTINRDCFCSANKEEDLPIEIKAIFQDLASLYFFIRQNCNNDRIKLTKNGNMILQYTIEQIVHQLKLENYPTQLPAQSIEDVWESFKQAWQRRKDQDFKQPLEGFYHKIKKSHISMHGSSRQRTPNPYLPSEELSAEDQNIQGDQQRKINSKGARLIQTVRTVERRARRDDSFESQENSRDWQSRQRGFRKFRDRSPRNYATPKVKTILKHYPEDYYQSQRRKATKVKSRRQMDYRRGRGRRSQPQQSIQSEEDRRKQRGQPVSKKLEQVAEAISYLRNQIDQIRKNTFCFPSIQRTLIQKFQFLASTVKKEVGTINSNLLAISQGSKQKDHALEFVDQETKKAYLMFYAQKMPHFRQHFQLADSSKVEDYLKELWSALGPKQQSSYFAPQMRFDERFKRKKIRKSSKSQQQDKIVETNNCKQVILERSSRDEERGKKPTFAEEKCSQEEDGNNVQPQDENDNRE